MPAVLIIALIEPDVFNGDYAKSALKFQRHGLESLELQVDNQPIVNHPLKLKTSSAIEYFCNYLRNTNRFHNVHSTGSLSYDDYVESNFLTFCNLKADGYQHGQVTLKLKFEQVLDEKLLCLFIPVYEKKLVFDSYLNAQVN